ncbi:MAG: hypothetical protein AAF708_09680 [Deinococcota bacterium]
MPKAYTRNFDTWNDYKKQLDTRKDAPRFNEREIWWCSLGANVGFDTKSAYIPNNA